MSVSFQSRRRLSSSLILGCLCCSFFYFLPLATTIAFQLPGAVRTTTRIRRSISSSTSTPESSGRGLCTTRQGLINSCSRKQTRYTSSCSSSSSSSSVRSTRLAMTANYGRGAEIWPPTKDEPIKLSESFPNGKIPEEARRVLQQIGSIDDDDDDVSSDNDTAGSRSSTTTKSGSIKRPREWRKIIPRAISRILRRAAAKEEEEAFLIDSDSSSSASTNASTSTNTLDKTPAVLALALLLFGYTKPLDWLLVSFLSGYFVMLTVAARATRRDGVTPTLPALPPNGHVPVLVSNPLGQSFTYSLFYHRWLKFGVLLGLLAPMLMALQCILASKDYGTATLILRPIFFLACQAMTESASRRAMTPLPIRILIPLAYNTVRLGYLWNWTFTTIAGTAKKAITNSNLLVKILAIVNLVYWAVNLFGFLIPVATMRYMRAHVIGVELEQATMRSGMEESVGLLS